MIISIALVGYFIVSHRRKKASALHSSQSKPNDDSEGLWSIERRRELPGLDQYHEMDANERKYELTSNQPLAHELPPGSNERVEISNEGQKFEMDLDAQRFELESNRPPAHELVDVGRAGESASPTHNARLNLSQSMRKASFDSVVLVENLRHHSSIFLFGKKVSHYRTAGK
jgi:hypothetical protein